MTTLIDGTAEPETDNSQSQNGHHNHSDDSAGFADFKSLGLGNDMLRALGSMGFEAPTPIQAGFIPKAMTGRDCIGQARTGTGKTAAFVIPVLEQIDHNSGELQAIVLAPTRELSEQVAAEASRLAAEHHCDPACLVGGRPIGRQVDHLNRKPTIAIGTPGRVLDLIRRGILDLSTIKIAILDEADRMLDIGFLPDIERILKHCPKERQTLLLSATMPAPVERLAMRFMSDPIRIDLSEDNVVTDAVEQFYCTVDGDRKFQLLVRLLRRERPHQAIVFCRTKRGADELHRKISKRLPGVAVIHGDLQQRQRDRVMRDFRAGKTRLLIATDVVGRGIDVSSISHIINYTVPEYCDDYVHRVGRTGRMSSIKKGRAFTFATKEEGKQLTNIEMRINLLLSEYTIDGFEAYRPGPKRQHVDDIVKPKRPEFHYA